jgi:hypothetical protein
VIYVVGGSRSAGLFGFYSVLGVLMAIKSVRRSSKKRRARTVKKRKRSSAPKRAASANAAPSKRNTAKGKQLPAWNEIEIDEQRENAGRPEPAFLTDEAYADDDLAEELGEEFVLTATSGEQAAEDLRNQDVPEELGGPFVETSGRKEFAYGSDPSNPKDAEPAAFPTVINSLEEPEAVAQAEGDEQEERPS